LSPVPIPDPKARRRRIRLEGDAPNPVHPPPTAISICVEVDAETGAIGIDQYVALHDAGRILNPLLLDGQVQGGFAMAIGAALCERLVYDADGGLLTASFLDYALPTAAMVPDVTILHQETPSPVTPLGAKGAAEGNAMSTPVCVANAVADALGVADLSLPLTSEKIWQMLRRRSDRRSDGA